MCNNENEIIYGNCIDVLKSIQNNSVHLILSDIPYGISIDDWDVLHNNSNSALLGASPAQEKAGAIFKKRGKPLNGWSEADKQIPKEYYTWCMSWVADWYNVLKPGGSVFVFAGRRLSHRCISAFEDSGFTFKDMICWAKDKAPHRAQRLSVVYDKRDDKENAERWDGWKVGNLRPIFEPILWFMKPYKLGGTLADNVIENEVGAYNEKAFKNYIGDANNIISTYTTHKDMGLHPTQKPLKLMKILIELTTIENQVVLDPFCGSGTTLVAAKALNRKYIGIENNLEYYNVAVNRLKDDLDEDLLSLII